MTLLAALCGATIVAGILLIAYGLTPQPARPPRPSRAKRRTWSKDTTIWIVALAAGAVAALATGWLATLLLVPTAILAAHRAYTGRRSDRTQRLGAVADFARGLGGVLSAGRGLEQSILHAARSAPTALAPEINRLAARIRANWPTATALRHFADDLDDATGDLFVATLILAAERRGPGVASAMQGLAESIDADVRARRQVETEQQKAKTAARIITGISILLLVGLFLAGGYVDAYRTPLGQVLLLGYMSLFLLVLVWMSRIARSQPLPRFMGTHLNEKKAAS